jgi:putative drug exporter of the RND superfamily
MTEDARTISIARGITLARKVIRRVLRGFTVLKKSTISGAKTTRDAFSLLGRFAVRAPWLMIGAWAGVVLVVSMVFTPLAKVVESKPLQEVPAAAMAAADQMAKDFGESGQNMLIVVLTDKQGLQPADEDVYRKLATTLRGDTNDVASVQDYLTTPELRTLMVSKDNKAFYMALSLKAPVGSPESSEAYQRVTQTVKHSTAGTALTGDVTGQAAMQGDLSIFSTNDMHIIEIATAALVLLILLIIYRRPVTVLLPLITIGVSVLAAQGTVSGLTHLGLGVSNLTMILMTTMIFGAGTDYAVFLISRYHEYVQSGMDSDTAVRRALSSIGKVIAGSAATVAVTFLGMIFARLPLFSSVGPSLAVSFAIAFLAGVTLLPAMLVLAGRRGWVKPRRALTGRLWRRSAVHIVRRPKMHLLVSLAVLIGLGACAAFLHTSFNDRMQLPQTAESNVGFTAMQDHFSTSTLLPDYIYVHSAHDLRTPQALADLDQMAQRVSQLPDIAAVRGITRPDGHTLDQAKLSNQVGQVGDTLRGVSTQITDKTDDLDALTNGADQLAGTLANVRDQVHSASRTMSGLTGTLSQVQHQLGAAANLVDSIRGLANSAGSTGLVSSAGPVLSSLNSPQCNADPACSAVRPELEQVVQGTPPTAIQGVQSTVDDLSAQLTTAIDDLRATASSGAGGIQQEMTRLESGSDALADGSAKLANGVRTLVDQTKQMGTAMNKTSDVLMSMKRDALGPSMSGLYIPQTVITSNDFKNAARLFISPDGHSARYLVETKLDPFSTAAMDQVESILDTARAAQPNTALSDASISMVGTTPMYSALRSYYDSDFQLIVIITLIVVFFILVVLLRAIVAPLYLIASVVISFGSALGVGVLFFQFVLGQHISWSVAAMAFIVLVALGADYNLLLITRIREESGHGIHTGIMRAVRSTGGVITSAGIIFAASMFGLMFGDLVTMLQTGFIIGMGLLIDTFVVRTITVPAMAALMARANWWPSKAARAKVAASAKKTRAIPPRTTTEDRPDQNALPAASEEDAPGRMEAVARDADSTETDALDQTDANPRGADSTELCAACAGRR